MKILKYLNLAMALGAMLMTGCHSSDVIVPEDNNIVTIDENGYAEVSKSEVDFDVLSRYCEGLKDATYTMTGFRAFIMDDLSDGKWEELNLREYDGWSPSAASELVLRGGCAWHPVPTFSLSTGPTAFGMALNAINKVQGKAYTPYTAIPLEINVDDYTAMINGRMYNLLAASDEELVISTEFPYWGGRTGNGGMEMELLTYKISEPKTFDDDKDIAFGSTGDAYDWLIDLFSETFGERVNLNDIYRPNVILDEPYLEIYSLIEEKEYVTRE